MRIRLTVKRSAPKISSIAAQAKGNSRRLGNTGWKRSRPRISSALLISVPPAILPIWSIQLALRGCE